MFFKSGKKKKFGIIGAIVAAILLLIGVGTSSAVGEDKGRFEGCEVYDVSATVEYNDKVCYHWQEGEYYIELQAFSIKWSLTYEKDIKYYDAMIGMYESVLKFAGNGSYDFVDDVKDSLDYYTKIKDKVKSFYDWHIDAIRRWGLQIEEHKESIEAIRVEYGMTEVATEGNPG